MSLWGILLYLALAASYVFATALVVKIIRQKRSPSGTIAWLMGIVLVPFVGVPLYVLFGGRKTRRATATKNPLDLRQDTAVGPLDTRPVDRMLRTYGIPGATGGNRVTLCRTGEDAYEQLLALIDGAEHSVHLATFIFSRDPVAAGIRDRLVARARDGLEVRLLMDGVGSRKTGGAFLAPLTEAGGRWAHFMPVRFGPWYGRTNLRNHRKLLVVDGQRVMAGGSNISREYMGPTPDAGRWIDLSFILEGPAATHYADVFRFDWEFATDERLDRAAPTDALPGDEVVQVVPSGPDVERDTLYYALLSSLFDAEERCWIVTPYFVPDESLLVALELAAHRGVDVRVIVPDRSNHLLPNLACGPYLRRLHDQGVLVLRHPSMVHAKAMLVDHRLAMIGSANFDIRSLFLNYEVAMFIYGESGIRATEAWIADLLPACQMGARPAGPFQDFIENAARMLAPIL
ncbi:PLDc N-terminal domain-containing protein [bacterium]|nr:PLDc N-terminal domain-containing protein [bacterium]